MLGSAGPDIASGKPVLFGDRPRLPLLYSKMIEAHFPQIPPKVAAWNALASRVADALSALQVRVNHEVHAQLTDPRYDQLELVQRMTEFVGNRAMRQELTLALQPPGQGTIWFHRALIAMEMFGRRVIDLSNIPEDEYEDTREQLVAPVDQLLQDAQGWVETVEVQDANLALISDPAGSALLQAVHAQQIRERIFVARGCPACGEIEPE